MTNIHTYSPDSLPKSSVRSSPLRNAHRRLESRVRRRRDRDEKGKLWRERLKRFAPGIEIVSGLHDTGVMDAVRAHYWRHQARAKLIAVESLQMRNARKGTETVMEEKTTGTETEIGEVLQMDEHIKACLPAPGQIAGRRHLPAPEAHRLRRPLLRRPCLHRHFHPRVLMVHCRQTPRSTFHQ